MDKVIDTPRAAGAAPANGLRRPRDFWLGAIFFGVAALSVWLSWSLPFGEARRMGPSYFPILLGGLLGLIGLFLIARGVLGEPEPMPPLRIKAPVLVLGSVLLFALLIRSAGLVAAIVVMVICVAPAAPGLRWRQVLLLAMVLAAGSVAVFVWGLGQPLPVLGSWFGR